MTAAPPFRLEKARESTGGPLFSQATKLLLPLFLVGSCRIPAKASCSRIDRISVATYFCGAMTDQPDNLVVTLLREMRGSLPRVEDKLDELVRRVSAVETNLAHVHVELAGHSARMDGMDNRIEKRLGLIDA
jgi:hypothetical protein